MFSRIKEILDMVPGKFSKWNKLNQDAFAFKQGFEI